VERGRGGCDAPRRDVEIHTPFSALAGEPYRGVAGYLRWRADITDQFDRWELRLDEIRALSEEQLLATGSARVRGRGSGIEFEQPAAGVVEVRDGRLLRVGIYLSHQEASRAAGVEGA
jgi:ketosteroid isomerase-like protein